jgi:hypothetical protein
MRSLFVILFCSICIVANATTPIVIKNSVGQVVATTEKSYGRITLKSRQGRVLGYYVEAENKTYKYNAQFVGNGNLLLTLIEP